MSFEIGGSTVVLEFEEGTILAGKTVRCRMDISIRKFLAIQRAFAAVSDGPDAVAEAYRQFGDSVLLSWDVAGAEGGPIPPATGEGMLDITMQSAQAIFVAWASAVSGTSGNSEAASTNGVTSEAAYGMMAPA